MRSFANQHVRLLVILSLVAVASCLTFYIQSVQAQSVAQIGPGAPLPVFVTNQVERLVLPEGFVQNSRWRFTTWTAPSVVSWVGTVNKTSGPWANLTISGDQGNSSTRWYYIPGMPGSWEKQ